MSPDLLALARAYVALPGAPTMTEALLSYGVGAKCYRRDSAGVLWVDGALENAIDYEWLPDLTDDATGGVMLGMLGMLGGVSLDIRTGNVDCTRAVWGYWLDGEHWRVIQPCATLAEACARVAVPLGRAA